MDGNNEAEHPTTTCSPDNCPTRSPLGVPQVVRACGLKILPQPASGRLLFRRRGRAPGTKVSCGDVVEPMSCMHGTRAVSVLMNQSLSRVGGWDKKVPSVGQVRYAADEKAAGQCPFYAEVSSLIVFTLKPDPAEVELPCPPCPQPAES